MRGFGVHLKADRSHLMLTHINRIMKLNWQTLKRRNWWEK